MKYLLVHLKKEFKRHYLDYTLLLVAGVFFLVSINLFKGQRFLEFVILLLFVSFYIIWGIYHHIVENTLHLKTVVEYILIGFTLLFLLKLIILP